MKHVYLTLFFLVALSVYSYGAEVNNKYKSINWFWFFYEEAESAAGKTVVYRPFYLEASNEENLFQASLMPIFFWRYKHNEKSDTTKGFFGFYESTDYKHSNGERDYDNGLIPLFLYGKGDRERDNYLFVYPLGGNIRGKLGYERISPYVFPGIALFFLYPPSGFFTWKTLFWTLASLIPVYTKFEFKEYNGYAILWPFIAWGKGDKREDFRFLPFYAHNSKEGKYDNYSYLLLINYRELYLSKDERYTFFFFPFFGKRWSKNERMKSYTILWPFFSWGYDLDKNETSYNLPWPLVQVADSDSPKMKKRIFFPFYGTYETSTYDSMFVGPFYFRIKRDASYYKSEYHVSFIIAWLFKREYPNGHEYYGRSWRYVKLWPLFQVEWNDIGLYAINVLSLLPFRDSDGYEKLYQPFWTLFEYRTKPDGEKHLGLILRTYYQVWNKDFFKMKIPVIISYEKRKTGITDFTILLGSFGYEKKRKGSYLKFLWIPVRIGEGDEDLIGQNDEANYDRYFLGYRFNPYHGDCFDNNMNNRFYYKTYF
jgi:hypothetical protein